MQPTTRRFWIVRIVALLVTLSPCHPVTLSAQQPINRENIEAALKLTQAAAAEYEIRVATTTNRSSCSRSQCCGGRTREEVHGNVFLWTRGGRPLVVGSLFKWFTPFTHMSHEFQSLAEEPLGAKFHGKPVWKTRERGLRFVDVPRAPAPAATEAQRLLQMKQLAKEFTSTKRERDENSPGELRLLPQPIHRYTVPKQGILNGGLFAFVQGTDPEIFLLIEARGENSASARWQFAATRMNSVELRLRHRDEQVWAAEILPGRRSRTTSTHDLRVQGTP
jgi:hypothetical protein